MAAEPECGGKEEEDGSLGAGHGEGKEELVLLDFPVRDNGENLVSNVVFDNA